jgi:hypothetical protein
LEVKLFVLIFLLVSQNKDQKDFLKMEFSLLLIR